MTKRLAPRQATILDYIEHYVDERGYAPNMREIAQHINSSTSVVHTQLGLLERAGYIERQRESSRAIRLIRTRHQPPETSALIQIPIVAQFQDGMHATAVSEAIELPATQAPVGSYAVRIAGSCVQNEPIDEGDILVIHPKARIRIGDLVLVHLADGCYTVRRIALGANGQMTITSGRPVGEPSPYKGAEIRGRAVRLIRNFSN